ncbi:MAG: hypothetical protein QOJ27_2501 [Sphingomonadales bacterium]|nr:hypothetical protein [Sphingomonadales bacterium]
MFMSRGTPVVYYGDEQGFAGDGGDQDARQDMFASRVASYNDDRLVGSSATTAQANFNRDSTLYRAIAGMAALRRDDPAISRGDQIVRASGDKPGLFAISRLAPTGGGETLIAFNTGTTPVSANIVVGGGSGRWTSVRGRCAAEAAAPGSYRVEVPALDYIVCRTMR